MRWTYRPELDGLRTIAVYLVLLFHTGLSWVQGGFVGVDLFFVLSGFLVSNVILSEIDKTGSLRVGNFYARRVRRLLPAAVVVIIATSLMFVLVAPLVQRLPMVEDAQSSLLYYANWHFLTASTDYFAADVDKSPFLHFWSLSIEEQYYLCFPVLLLVLIKFAKRFTLSLFVALGVLFTASVVAQIYWAQVDTSRAYYGTDARLYQLLAGALLAVLLRSRPPVLSDRTNGAVAGVGLVGILVVGSGLLDVGPSVRGLLATVVSVLAIGGLTLSQRSWSSHLMARRTPVYLGKISYGTYLWHWPVILLLGEVLTTSPTVIAVITIAVATGLAAVSYEVLEMPVRKGQLLDRLRWTPAVIGVATSALVAVTIVPTVLESDRKPALNDLEASSTSGADLGPHKPIKVPANVDWEAVSKDIGKTGSCQADDPDGCTVVDGNGPNVLLIGDSQAQMLVPMFEQMARDHDFQLSLNVYGGCLWQEDLLNAEQSAEGAAVCDKARVGWYDNVLPLLKADVVILVERARDTEKEWGDVISRRDGKDQSLQQMIDNTSNDTLDKIAAHVPKVVVVHDLVMPNTFVPNECLTSTDDASRCAVPVPLARSVSDGFYETAAVRSPRIDTVDLNPAFCPGAPVCQAVVGDKIVWRDDHHYTASYAISRRQEVWKILTDSGVIDSSH
jgi:peptidoglycan/LPS O-acetylase OafA/YrhL